MIETFLKDALEHQRMQDYDSARALFNKCVLMDSSNYLTYFLIGNLEKDLGNVDKAILNFQISITHNANYINSYLNLSYLYFKNNNHKTAIEVLKTGILSNQNNIELRFQLAEAYVITGKLINASKIYDEIVKLYPKNFYAIYRLYQLGKNNLDKNLKKSLKVCIKDSNTPSNQKKYANLLLAKYETKTNRSDLEFKYLKDAHNIIYEEQKEIFHSNNQFIFNKLKNIQNHFDSNINFQISNNTREKLKPIFLFGLPRSGSTLIEKILIKGNSGYVSGEETKFFNPIANTIFKNNNNINSTLLNIYNSFNDRFELNKNNVFFTDKSLNNFFFLGWVKKVFPNAKLINCIRSPYIIISSILNHNLSNLSWAHRLEDIISYIDLYHEVTLKWEKEFEINFYKLHYSNLVNDFETESKKLFDYCEIDWNKDIVDFNKNNEYISKTASNIKIREKLSKFEDAKYKSLAEYLYSKIRKPEWIGEI